MNRLATTLAKIKEAGNKALIPFLTAGDPNPAATETLMATLAESGADVIELGVPFSDPLADGPVLQEAAARALQAGTTPDSVFTIVANFRKHHETPVVLLVYYNTIYRRGVEKFCRDAKEAGVDALVVPDVPYEEAGRLDTAAVKHELLNIRFLSPTTSEQRMIRICKSAAGFIYCVSVTGVTGEQACMDHTIEGLLSRARELTDVPLALGFGISTPEQAKSAAAVADAVIVGSALVKRVAAIADEAEKCKEAAAFIKSLNSAISGGIGHAG